MLATGSIEKIQFDLQISASLDTMYHSGPSFVYGKMYAKNSIRSPKVGNNLNTDGSVVKIQWTKE